MNLVQFYVNVFPQKYVCAANNMDLLCVSISYGLLTQKVKNAEKPKLSVKKIS